VLRDPGDVMVQEVSMADKDDVWDLWQAPIGKGQQRTSGIWSEALPSSADNSSPFKK